MSKLFTALGLATVLLFVLVPAASARDLHEDQVIFGGSFLLAADETLDGDLVVFGGSVTVEKGALINGDVVVMGGAVHLAGEASGDMVIFGGGANLEDTAIVHGDLVTVGGGISKSPGAVIHGLETSAFRFPFRDLGSGSFNPFEVHPFGSEIQVGPAQRDVVRLRVDGLLGDAVGALLWSLGLGTLGLLLFTFVPEHLNRIGQAAVANPLTTGGLGLLTAITVPLLALALLITICLSPFGMAGAFVLIVAATFGWVALGSLIGQRMMAASVVRGTSPAVAAAVGVFVLTLLSRVLALAPGIGWVFVISSMLVVSVGLGAVVLTRFGRRPWVMRGAIVARAESPAAPERADRADAATDTPNSPSASAVEAETGE